MSDQASNASFFEVNDFKSHVASETSTLEVLRNKSTGKLFMSIDGTNYRVQGNIDNTKPMKVLVPEEDGVKDWDNACLINVDPTKGADSIFNL